MAASKPDLTEWPAYMFRHSAVDGSAAQIRASLESTCAKTKLHEPRRVAASDWKIAGIHFRALPARL